MTRVVADTDCIIGWRLVLQHPRFIRVHPWLREKRPKHFRGTGDIEGYYPFPPLLCSFAALRMPLVPAFSASQRKDNSGRVENPVRVNYRLKCGFWAGVFPLRLRVKCFAPRARREHKTQNAFRLLLRLRRRSAPRDDGVGSVAVPKSEKSQTLRTNRFPQDRTIQPLCSKTLRPRRTRRFAPEFRALINHHRFSSARVHARFTNQSFSAADTNWKLVLQHPRFIRVHPWLIENHRMPDQEGRWFRCTVSYFNEKSPRALRLGESIKPKTHSDCF